MITYFEISHTFDNVPNVPEEHNIIVCFKHNYNGTPPTEEEFAEIVQQSKGLIPQHKFVLESCFSLDQSDISEYQQNQNKLMYCVNLDADGMVYQIYGGDWIPIKESPYSFVNQYIFQWYLRK